LPFVSVENGALPSKAALRIVAQAPAIDAQTGDQLVFRYTGSNTTGVEAYIPNGDGPNSNGRIPNITLP